VLVRIWRARHGYQQGMSTTVLAIVCIVAGLVLVVMSATVMLAPVRLRRPFSAGYTRRQWAALRERRRARSGRGRRPWEGFVDFYEREILPYFG
jgi:hypothetical protein